MRLLIIGKVDGQIIEASKIAKDRGASVANCVDIDSALSQLCSGKGADLLMIDAMEDIKRLISSLKQERVYVPVVAYGVDVDSKQAADAIRAGAQEYIPLPPDEELIAAVLEAIAEESSSFVYESQAMKDVVALARRVASSDASVLITGESGTGKEVIARLIHNKSNRSKEGFISVNCAAIPDNLLESELFGHEKGAFTGATHRRIGKFEESNNGTLLLDEISEMDAKLQAKLLRAIQEQEIDRVGGAKPIKLNLRILATSNRNLKEEVEKGNFREDLLFRLNVININLPQLKNRKEDIKPLAEYFAKKYADSNGLNNIPVSSQAFEMLKSYNWPGNVRELENAMHRAVLLATGDKIDEKAVILEGAGGFHDDSTGSDVDIENFVGRTVESVEKDLIIGTLDHCLGNRTHAANVLGISIRTLRNKLKQYEEAAG